MPASATAERKPDDCCIVGIGLSTRGRDAALEFFTAMPADAGMSFVVIQQLDADAEPILPEEIAERTTMPVRSAEEKTRLVPNTIYVVTPDRSFSVVKRCFRAVTPEPSEGAFTPIDSFFRSLGHDQGAYAVGVILAGEGSDGTLGARTIKEQGGMVVAQDLETTELGGMPFSAIHAGVVDFVLPIIEIPDSILAFHTSTISLTDPDRDATLHESVIENIDIITAQLRRATGHDFSQYKRSTLSRRVQRRMSLLNIPTLQEYVALLQRGQQESILLFHDLLISVTYFFRDAQAFQALTDNIIPTLIREQEKNGGDSIRIWIPGCATGEEAYSIAMIVADHMERHGITREVKIFATDIDLLALEFARKGTYPDTIAAQVPAPFLKRFFTRHADRYTIRKDLRDMIIFSPHSLVKDPPFSRLDLISCRNLLIYLESEEQKRILDIFHYALKPGGALFLGSSENISSHTKLFQTIDKKHRLFRKKEALLGPRIPTPRFHYDGHGIVPSLRTERTKANRLQARQTIEHTVLQHYAPTYIVVDTDYQILYTSGQTSDYLEIPDGDINTNILDMARKGLGLHLRTALYEASRTRAEVVKEGIHARVRTGERRLRIVVTPVREVEEDLLMILFYDLGPIEEVETAEHVVDEDHPAVRHLGEELRTTREQLESTIEELETTNEELKSSNEELLSMNEELQSSNEELQTSKEEIQSMNEELHTINGELNQKIDEVNLAHSDLQNLFQSTRIPMIFVGADMRIKRFSPETRDLLRVIEGDIGRSISDVKTSFVDGNLEEHIHQVIATLMPFEEEVHLTDSNRSYQMRIIPYRTIDNVIDGVVITFSEVTLFRQAQERKRYITAMLDHIPEGLILVDAETLQVEMASHFAREMSGLRLDLLGDRPIGSEGMAMVYRGDGVTPCPMEEWPIMRAIRTGEIVINEKIYIQGREPRLIPVLCNAAPVFDDDGKIVAGVSTWRDISEIEATQLALRDGEIRFRAIAGEMETIYHHIPIGIAVVDRHYTYIRINDYLAQIQGLSVEEHIGQNAFELFPMLEEKAKPLIDQVIATGEPIHDIVFSTPAVGLEIDGDNPEFHWNASYIPMKDDEGETQFVLAVIRDVTAPFKAEAELLKSREAVEELNMELEKRVEERTEQVRTLSAALSMAERSERRRLSFILHDDLQQILFGMEMKMQIARHKLQEAVDQKMLSEEIRGEISDHIEEISPLLTSAIDVTRKLSVELNPPIEHEASVAGTLKWVAQHKKTRYDLDVILDVPEDLWLSRANLRLLMVQLLRELIFNIAKHAETKTAWVTARSVDHSIELTVTDKGKGFDLAAARSKDERGLGLFSIEERVRLIGGTFEVDTAPGKGTTVRFTLPLE